MLQRVREREDVKGKDRMGRGVERNVCRLDRQQDATMLVSAPVEITCEVQGGGAEMCSPVCLSPAVGFSADACRLCSPQRDCSAPSESTTALGSAAERDPSVWC